MLLGQFPTLSLALVHKAIAYYLENKGEIDSYMARCDAEMEELRAKATRGPDIVELRRRMEAMPRPGSGREPWPWPTWWTRINAAKLWRAIQRHNGLGPLPIDSVRVGDPADLPLGYPGSGIAIVGRAAVAHSCVIRYERVAYALRQSSCRRTPLTRPVSDSSKSQDYECCRISGLAAYASDEYEWIDRIEYIG
jgi:hypothetical protein